MNWSFLKDIFQLAGIPLYLGLTFFLLAKTYPALKSIHNGKRILKKDEMERIFQLFSEEKYQSNPFLFEQVIEYKYGKPISFREISYILKLESPSEAFNDYFQGRQHLAFYPLDEEPNYRGWSLNPTFRKIRKIWNSFFYFFFAMLGLTMVPFAAINLYEKGPFMFSANIFFLAYCLVVAYLCLRGAWALNSSNNFMQQVEKYQRNLTR